MSGNCCDIIMFLRDAGYEVHVDQGENHLGMLYAKNPHFTAGSPIFKAVQKKRYQALYRALKKSLTAPESAVAMDSERSHIEQSVGTP
jgi:hypothetical protein